MKRQDQAIVAYKAWEITAYSIYSPVFSTAWKPRQHLKANCFRDKGVLDLVCFPLREIRHLFDWTPPMNGCDCGIYGLASLNDLVSQFDCRSHLYLYGEVSLWGKLEIHGSGYKAQYAYPRTFFLYEEEQEYPLIRAFNNRVRHLANIYGIEVALMPSNIVILGINKLKQAQSPSSGINTG